MVNEPHWELAYIDRVIWVLPVLINDVEVSILHLWVVVIRVASRGLDGPEPSAFTTLDHGTSSPWWDHATSSRIIPGLILGLILSWEKSLLAFIVLSIIKCHVLVLSRSHGASSCSGYPCGIGRVTILSLHWLDY